MKNTLIAGLLLLASCGQPALAWDIDAMNDLVDQTNFIVGRGCSGTLIDLKEKFILTNYHCIADQITETSSEKKTKDGVVRVIERKLGETTVTQKRYEGATAVGSSTSTANIVAADKGRDLAVLQVRGALTSTMAAKLLPGGEIVRRGETIYIVGNPLGLDATMGRGIIASITREYATLTDTMFPYIQQDAGTFFGNSGGALYNDKGYLIGVPALVIPIAPHLGFAIPVQDTVRLFLQENCLMQPVDCIKKGE